jgi:hypothetical protein
MDRISVLGRADTSGDDPLGIYYSGVGGRMPSVIVSRSRIGVALLFRRLDDQARQALQELLTARQC